MEEVCFVFLYGKKNNLIPTFCFYFILFFMFSCLAFSPLMSSHVCTCSVLCVCVCMYDSCCIRVVLVYVCIQIHMLMCMCRCQRRTLGVLFCHFPLFMSLEPLRQGFSLNLKLCWWPKSPSDPPVFTSHTGEATDVCDHVWLFMWVLWIWTQNLHN